MSNKKILFILFLAFLSIFYSCKRDTNLEKSVLIEIEKDEKDEKDENYQFVNSEGQAILHVFDTLDRYIGTIGTKACFIRFTHSDKDRLEGYFYPIDSTHIVITPHYFSISTQGRNYCLSTNTSDFQFNMKYQVNATQCNGKAARKTLNSSHQKIIDFNFSKYETDNASIPSKRYLKTIFEVEEQHDVVYGHAKGPWTSLSLDEEDNYATAILPYVFKAGTMKDLPLTMDIYSPKNDTLKNRPLVVLIHGGAFFFGDKADNEMIVQCRHLASLGYVVASINYRMGFEMSKISIQRCAYKAIQDAHAALRFLTHFANKYGIDKERMYIGGSSAGSIIAMNMVYMNDRTRPKTTLKKHFAKNNGNLHDSGNDYRDTFNICGLLNFWGALYEINEIKDAPISILSIHGTADKIVPYDYGYPFAQLNGKNGKGKLCNWYFDKMYGSNAIHKTLSNSKIHKEFYSLDSLGHAPWKDQSHKLNETYYFIEKKMSDFLAKDLIQDIQITRSGTVHYEISNAPIKNINWQLTGGIIIPHKNYDCSYVEVRWLSDEKFHQIKASGILNNDAEFSVSKQIKVSTQSK